MPRRRRKRSYASASSAHNYTQQNTWEAAKQKSASKLRAFARRFCSSCCCCCCCDIDCKQLDVQQGDYHVRRRESKMSAMASRKEARAVYRMAFLTAAQWSIVMKSCELQLMMQGADDDDASELLTRVMEWRRKRGDFEYSNGDGEAEEEDAAAVFDDITDDVPRLCDDLEGVNEAILQLGFLKSDLQLECLLRGISYEGCDSKASLISKLLHHKHFSCLTSNSFHTLAEQSK